MRNSRKRKRRVGHELKLSDIAPEGPISLAEIAKRDPVPLDTTYFKVSLGITDPHDKILIRLADAFGRMQRALCRRGTSRRETKLTQSRIADVHTDIERFIAAAKNSSHGRLDKIPAAAKKYLETAILKMDEYREACEARGERHRETVGERLSRLTLEDISRGQQMSEIGRALGAAADAAQKRAAKIVHGVQRSGSLESDYKKLKYQWRSTVDLTGLKDDKGRCLVKIGRRTVPLGPLMLRLLLKLVAGLKESKAGWVDTPDIEALLSVESTHIKAQQRLSELRAKLEGRSTRKNNRIIENDYPKKYRLSVHPDLVTYNKKALSKNFSSVAMDLIEKLP